jgi:hypothetical protein
LNTYRQTRIHIRIVSTARDGEQPSTTASYVKLFAHKYEVFGSVACFRGIEQPFRIGIERD